MHDLYDFWQSLDLQKRCLVGGIAALFTFSLFFGLGAWGVQDSSEARYAHIGLEMYESGDYLHPRYLGIEHYHKPPLTYYLTAFAFHVFGPSPFAARVLLQCCFLLQIFLVWRLARLLLADAEAALWSAGIYATMIIAIIAIRHVTTDAYLATCILGCALALSAYGSSQKPRYLYLAAIVAGLGFLTKITAFLVFIAPIAMLVWLRFRPRIRWSWHFPTSFLLFLAISLSWFAVLQLEGKPILRYMLYDQSVLRYSTQLFKRGQPFYFYLALAPLVSFPWLVMIAWRVIKTKATWPTAHTKWLLLLWGLLPIAFFSLSHSKLLLYILPCFAAIAIVAGSLMQRLSGVGARTWLAIQNGFFLVLLMGATTYAMLQDSYVVAPMQVICTLAALAGIVALWLGRGQGAKAKMVMCSIVFLSGVLLAGTFFLSNNDLQTSTLRPVATWIAEQRLDKRPIYLHNQLLPSLAFHLERNVALIADKPMREVQFEDSDTWKQYYYLVTEQERKSALLDRLQTPSCLVVKATRAKWIDPDILAMFGESTEVGRYRIYH